MIYPIAKTTGINECLTKCTVQKRIDFKQTIRNKNSVLIFDDKARAKNTITSRYKNIVRLFV